MFYASIFFIGAFFLSFFVAEQDSITDAKIT